MTAVYRRTCNLFRTSPYQHYGARRNDSIATVLYIDDLDNVFIEWVSNGRLTSFSKKNFKSLFDMAG